MKVWRPEGGITIKSWCENLDVGSFKQAEDLAKHPSMAHHVALMPDCHKGYGMPIGGVIACKDVIPNAVGVDIGCGMMAVQTNLAELDTETLKQLMGEIRKVVPVGFSHQQAKQEWDGWDDVPNSYIVCHELNSARKQLGTLGGGNHFIEIQRGDNGYVWIMIHSGSRNFGLKIAKYYNDLAQELCTAYHSVVCPFEGQDGLAFLPTDSAEATDYIRDMNYALRFAAENRWLMMRRVKDVFITVTDCEFEAAINIHHNYARRENHFGKNLWIHRKGATSAYAGQAGIIPGSMGTSSYIVEGLGNEESYQSCSHGAGRLMGRNDASKRLTVEDCDKAMEGIVHGRWGTNRKGVTDLGEAPGAYKNIDQVMAAQADLVKIKTKLTPLGVIKG